MLGGAHRTQHPKTHRAGRHPSSDTPLAHNPTAHRITYGPLKRADTWSSPHATQARIFGAEICVSIKLSQVTLKCSCIKSCWNNGKKSDFGVRMYLHSNPSSTEHELIGSCRIKRGDFSGPWLPSTLQA